MTEGFLIYGDPVRGRSCGGCTLCCTLVPVQLPTGDKPANTRCPALSATKRCRIYAARPRVCRMWSCRWLFDDDTAELRRPDHAGYVIDPMLDTVLIDGKPVEVLQVWCDPKRPEAHRDPALRAYLEGIAAEYRLPAIVRYDSARAFGLFAPPITDDGQWFEQDSEMHTAVEMAAKIAASRGTRAERPLVATTRAPRADRGGQTREAT